MWRILGGPLRGQETPTASNRISLAPEGECSRSQPAAARAISRRFFGVMASSGAPKLSPLRLLTSTKTRTWCRATMRSTSLRPTLTFLPRMVHPRDSRNRAASSSPLRPSSFGFIPPPFVRAVPGEGRAAGGAREGPGGTHPGPEFVEQVQPTESPRKTLNPPKGERAHGRWPWR